MTPVKTVEELETLYAGVVPFQAVDVRRQRAVKQTLRAGLISSIALNLGLIVTLCELMPLKTVVPVIGFTNEAGLFDTATTISDLPPDKQVAGIEALLWTYLRDREGYAPSEADAAYDVVSKLSNDTVKTQYQTYVNVKLNAAAPAKLLGPNGFIRINRLGADWVAHTENYSSGTYQIRFCRTVVMQNMPPARQRLSANISYDLISAVPLEQRITFNPVGLTVTEYPGPREEGAANAVNPCG